MPESFLKAKERIKVVVAFFFLLPMGVVDVWLDFFFLWGIKFWHMTIFLQRLKKSTQSTILFSRHSTYLILLC
jgi:hypothetical protein